ncbi:MAG: hypothetical protein HRU33_02940 [Rhodobacteraceae bacterium]|nr:hypothetical protein [Paracoccaceae bacterium]
MSFGLRLVAEYQVRQVLILLAVSLISTLNQYAARFWPKHRWWFWAVSALNIRSIFLAAVAFATALPELPALIWWLTYFATQS